KHVAPKHHRLEIEAAFVAQHACDPREEIPINLLLPPGAVVLRRAEVLEGAEARDRVELAEALASEEPRVVKVNVQAVPPAGRELAQAQPDDPIDQRVGELEILALRHRAATIADCHPDCGEARAARPKLVPGALSCS